MTYAFDGMDLVVGVRDAGKNLNKTSDDTVTVFERDGLGRALTVTEGAVTRERLFDGHLLVASGDTQLVRDPFGGVLAELDQVVQGNGRWATMVTRQQDVLTDVLGSTVAVAVDGVIDADLRLFGDFGEELTEPGWDTVTGFTGKVETAGLTEFVTRAFDVDARVWVSDVTYRGQVSRASSMNRYAYVEGAPESFVDHLGFFRAAAALEAQRLAAAEAAWLAAQKAARSAAPTNCSGYGCYMKWQAESPARFMAQQPLHVRGYAYALQVIAYADYQAQLKQYQAENYAYARAGTTREAEALRIYNEKLAIHHRWQAEQAAIEHERAQLLFYDTVTATAKTLSDPSTAIHLTLDVLGMIPVIGEPADGLNALIYLAEGDPVNAAISAAGMIPIGGMAATGARAVKTAVKTGLEAAAQISATSVTMLKVTPPAPATVLKTNASAATMPTAPVGAATPPAPKPADTAPQMRSGGSDSPTPVSAKYDSNDPRYYAKSVTEGGHPAGDPVIAGHGELRIPSDTTVVPEGTRVATYAEDGQTITDQLGKAVEGGDGPVPTRIYEAGEAMPNYTVKPPDRLNVFDDSIMVSDATLMENLLRPDMGLCHLAICLVRTY